MKMVLPEVSSARELSAYGVELLVEMYRRMFLIREFENRANELFLRGLMPGTIHLSHGQEATPVGTCLALRDDDLITLTHRGHGQALAKGVPARSLMAELFGKETGCCGGRGGSLHVGDYAFGALPAIAVVGASAPIAAGLAFACRRRGNGRVVVNFFGEGAANKGELHEAMNLAAIWSLPVIFVCENNLYAVSTHLSDAMLNDYVSERASAYRMPGVTVGGNDPIEVYEALTDAVTRARDGGGPTLVECLTYRHGGHKRDDAATYRPVEEVEAWLARDPLPSFRERLVGNGRIGEDDLGTLEEEIQALVTDAVEFAQASDFPAAESAFENVYA
jgi:acetoin:2,6-dichlorophenolindophenol oxidoreductase subunit alpha